MHDIGWLLRFDDQVEPTMYRCATVTTTELAQLQRIKQVIRLGKVVSLTATQIELEQGVAPTSSNTLHIDCTADGLARRPAKPIFSDQGLTLQSVRTCQQVFSAAFIAHMEVAEPDLARKNLLCTPVSHPDTDMDYLRNTLADLVNGAIWGEDESLQAWIKAARLDGFSYLASGSAEEDAQYVQNLQKYGPLAAEKLMTYLAEAGTA